MYRSDGTKASSNVAATRWNSFRSNESLHCGKMTYQAKWRDIEEFAIGLLKIIILSQGKEFNNC